MSAFGLDKQLMKIEPVNKALTAVATYAQPFIDENILPYAKLFVSNEWVCYGLAPTLSVFFGCMISCIIFEWMERQPWCEKYLIVYSRRQTRAGELAKTQAKVDWLTQAKGTFWEVAGPLNIIGCFVQWQLLSYLRGGAPTTPLPSLAAHLIDFWMLMLICDFGLFLGHWSQHVFKSWWDNWHSIHHRLATPSAFSLAYIHHTDAFLQSALPLIVGQVIVRAHPVTHCLYLYFHLQNNAINHSGIHCWWLDILVLRFLPGRCDTRLHDAHHRYSGFGPGAKNFAEMFWIWDWMFGTLSLTGEVMSQHAAAKREKSTSVSRD